MILRPQVTHHIQERLFTTWDCQSTKYRIVNPELLLSLIKHLLEGRMPQIRYWNNKPSPLRCIANINSDMSFRSMATFINFLKNLLGCSDSQRPDSHGVKSSLVLYLAVVVFFALS
ncbi:hypothetical protein Droror1_Dr00008529 [Drosera rotundifolia]